MQGTKGSLPKLGLALGSPGGDFLHLCPERRRYLALLAGAPQLLQTDASLRAQMLPLPRPWTRQTIRGAFSLSNSFAVIAPQAPLRERRRRSLRMPPESLPKPIFKAKRKENSSVRVCSRSRGKQMQARLPVPCEALWAPGRQPGLKSWLEAAAPFSPLCLTCS